MVLVSASKESNDFEVFTPIFWVMFCSRLGSQSYFAFGFIYILIQLCMCGCYAIYLGGYVQTCYLFDIMITDYIVLHPNFREGNYDFTSNHILTNFFSQFFPFLPHLLTTIHPPLFSDSSFHFPLFPLSSSSFQIYFMPVSFFTKNLSFLDQYFL